MIKEYGKGMINMRRRIVKGVFAVSLAAAMIIGTAVCGTTVNAAQDIPAAGASEQTEGKYMGFEWSLNYFGGETYVTIDRYTGSSKRIIIPDEINGIKVVEIGPAFRNMKYLREITISKNVKLINREFVSGCEKLENIYVDNENEDYSSVKGYLCNKEGNLLYLAPTGKKGTVYIPQSIESIELLAFQDCKGITKVVAKSSMTKLGYMAFSGCDKLEEVILRGNMQSIEYSFDKCPELRSITLEGKQDKYITKDGVLFEAGVDGSGKKVPVSLVRYPEKKALIHDEAGEIVGLAEYTIPDTVESIEPGAFMNCQAVTVLNVHKNVSRISESAFDGSIVSNIKINAKNNYYRFKNGMLIGKKTADKNRTGDVLLRVLPTARGKLVIPETITEIDAWALSNSSIDEVVIAKSVKKIGAAAFENCDYLRKVTIPAGVDVIEERTFSGCDRLISVTLEASAGGTKKTIKAGAFEDCPRLIIVKLPKAVAEIDRDAFLGSNSVTIYGKAGSYALEFARKYRLDYSSAAPKLKVVCTGWMGYTDDNKLVFEYDAAGGKEGYQYAVYYRKAGSSKWSCARDYSTKRTATIRPKSKTDYEIMIKVKDKVGKVAQTVINVSADIFAV